MFQRLQDNLNTLYNSKWIKKTASLTYNTEDLHPIKNIRLTDDELKNYRIEEIILTFVTPFNRGAEEENLISFRYGLMGPTDINSIYLLDYVPWYSEKYQLYLHYKYNRDLGWTMSYSYSEPNSYKYCSSSTDLGIAAKSFLPRVSEGGKNVRCTGIWFGVDEFNKRGGFDHIPSQLFENETINLAVYFKLVPVQITN